MRKLRTYELNRLNPVQYSLAEKVPLVVVLDNIRSCNNIGSLFRTADALLIEALYLCGFTAIPPNKEIHKTALDAEKTVCWKYFEKTEEAVSSLKEEGYKVFAVEQTEASIMLHRFTPLSDDRLALIFGNEVRGVAQEVINMCDGAIEIPQFGTKHSFNVAVSAGIVLWDIVSKIKLY